MSLWLIRLTLVRLILPLVRCLTVFLVEATVWIKSITTKLWDGMAIETNEVTATVYYKNQKTMSQGSKQTTSNCAYKSDERRKQVHKHYQTRTGDDLQELWNHYTIPRRDDEFTENRLIGQLIAANWLSGFQDDAKIAQLHTRCPKEG